MALPASSGKPLGFLMCRLDCLDPDTFKYEITSKEIASAKG
jgi:hypothetical protein